MLENYCSRARIEKFSMGGGSENFSRSLFDWEECPHSNTSLTIDLNESRLFMRMKGGRYSTLSWKVSE